MGNKPSKSKSSHGAFPRVDTQASTKSGLSVKSNRSGRSNRSKLSTGTTDTREYADAIATNRDTGAEFEGSLPRSLQTHEPKDSILIYRDRNGNIRNSHEPQETSSDVGGIKSQNNENTEPSAIADESPNSSDPSQQVGTGGTPISSTKHFVTTTPVHRPSAGSVASGASGDCNSGTPTSVFQRELPFSQQSRTPGATEILTGEHGSLNVSDTIQTLLDVGFTGKTPRTFTLKGWEVALICQAARDILMSQPTLLELQPPVKVVGDVHGQYGDLLRLFNMCGFPPESNYLFLGDYVDRGKQSLETIVLLLCYKIKYPENFFILRGNHECAGVTRIYGFYDECKRRASMKSWRAFIDTFNCLPIAAVVAGKIFCVHGGLSPSITSINDVRSIERPTDVPDYGLLNDLLWSDPTDGPNEWEDNERGVSYCYNKVAINKFLQRFGYDLVCRAHMVVEDGYEFFNDRSLVTVFSAPNYCGEFDNWGAVMSVSEELLCSFELLKPLDSAALKEEMKREKHERRASQLSL